MKQTSFFQHHPGGLQKVVHYEFEEVGEEIPLHEHDYWHSCLCVKGSCKVYNEEKSKTIKAGEFTEFKPGIKHAVQAQEAGTITIHIDEVIPSDN